MLSRYKHVNFAMNSGLNLLYWYNHH